MTVQVCRLKLAIGGPNSGWGDWRLYDDQDEFLDALFEAAIEAEARKRGVRRDEHRRWRRCLLWFEGMMLRTKEHIGIERIVAAERLVDGEWEPVQWELKPPSITIINEGKPVEA